MRTSEIRELALLIAIALLAIALIVVVTLNLWGLTLQIGQSVDYTRFGTWSDAIAGLGSLLAVLAAAAAIVGERLAARREEQAERERRETEVHHWLDYAELRDELGGHRGWRWTLHFQNGTHAPLYDWAVDFPKSARSITSAEKSPLKPGESLYNIPFLDDLAPADAPQPILRFKDRTGRWWQRSAQGTLELLQQSLSAREGSTR